MNKDRPTEFSPRLVARRESILSPWVTLVEKEVRLNSATAVEKYLALSLADYVAIVAWLPDGRIPLVRQFRPAVEGMTWELPSGMVDAGEDPAESCRRELLEETGLIARRVSLLGRFCTDTGRLENRSLTYLVEADPAAPGFCCEPGIEVKLVTWLELRDRIGRGEFDLQIHLGSLFLAWNHFAGLGQEPFYSRESI